MTTLKELKESAFAIKRTRSTQTSSNSRITRKKTFRKKKLKALLMARKSNKFHVIVDGVDRGEHLTSTPHSHSQASRHFAKKYPNRSVQVRIMH